MHISDGKALITDEPGRRGYGRNKLRTYTKCSSQNMQRKITRRYRFSHCVKLCDNSRRQRSACKRACFMTSVECQSCLMVHRIYILPTCYLRNKLHFSEVHGSMNATGHVQSKWRPKGVTLTLHGTRCVLTSMNLRKMKFISYIHTLFYIVFVHYLWIFFFYLNLASKRRRKVITRGVWLLRSTAVTMT